MPRESGQMSNLQGIMRAGFSLTVHQARDSFIHHPFIQIPSGVGGKRVQLTGGLIMKFFSDVISFFVCLYFTCS